MDDGPRDLLPRPPRHQVCAGKTVSVSVERAAGRCPPTLTGALVDLSLGGAKVSVDAAIAFQETVTLNLENRDLGVELLIAGQVRWLRHGPHGTWVLGCSFYRPLVRDALESLFAGGVLERRKSIRHPLVARATVDWELGPQHVPVELLDLSAGGFGMLAHEPGTIGGRLCLVLKTCDGNKHAIRATTRWQLKSPEGYWMGCEFLYHQGYHLMNALQRPAETVPPTAPRSGRLRLAILRFLGS